jgi:SAM-dependent methyltransferase
MSDAASYQQQLEREAKHWGDRLKVELVEAGAWLDHPFVSAHYRERGLIDGVRWEEWITRRLDGPPAKSMELGCGSAGRSMMLFDDGLSRWVDGLDVSPDRVAEGNRLRHERHAPGTFGVGDANTLQLPANTYDLIFSCHSFHHFQALEHVMGQVQASLTPRGFFVLEEFVGPTQFQWTDRQIDIVRMLTQMLPEHYRRLRWGAIKPYEGRPKPSDVVAVSPFESIRSAEIVPLFRQYFDVVEVRLLGGTLQHLLHNGIIHNFAVDDAEALKYLRAIYQTEDALVDAGLIPSDFQLLVGRRKP